MQFPFFFEWFESAASFIEYKSISLEFYEGRISKPIE